MSFFLSYHIIEHFFIFNHYINLDLFVDVDSLELCYQSNSLEKTTKCACFVYPIVLAECLQALIIDCWSHFLQDQPIAVLWNNMKKNNIKTNIPQPRETQAINFPIVHIRMIKYLSWKHSSVPSGGLHSKRGGLNLLDIHNHIHFHKEEIMFMVHGSLVLYMQFCWYT